MHPGPGAMPPDPATLAAAADAAAAESGGGGATEEGADAPAAAAAAKLDDVNGGRQTRRRWRLLQYVLGWVEGAALGGGGSVGCGGGASVETEEALSVATVALVAVTCPGPPAAEGGAATGGVAASRRPFLVGIGDAPCPTAADFYVASGEEEWLTEGGSDRAGSGGGGGAIADGVWGGVLDNLGPFLRYNGSVGATRRGWAAATARSVWGYGSAGCSARGSGDADLPMFVDFMAPTLKECGTLLTILQISSQLFFFIV